MERTGSLDQRTGSLFLMLKNAGKQSGISRLFLRTVSLGHQIVKESGEQVSL